MEMLPIPLGPPALVTLLLRTLGRPSKKPNQEGLVCCLALQSPAPTHMLTCSPASARVDWIIHADLQMCSSCFTSQMGSFVREAGGERARDVCLWKCKETKLDFFFRQILIWSSVLTGSDVDAELQRRLNMLDHNNCAKSKSLNW